jgi:hypothetical protein
LVVSWRIHTTLGSCAFLCAAFSVCAESCASWKATFIVAEIVELAPAIPRACFLLAGIAYGSSADLTSEFEVLVVARTVQHVCSWVVLFAFAASPFRQLFFCRDLAFQALPRSLLLSQHLFIEEALLFF